MSEATINEHWTCDQAFVDTWHANGRDITAYLQAVAFFEFVLYIASILQFFVSFAVAKWLRAAKAAPSPKQGGIEMA